MSDHPFVAVAFGAYLVAVVATGPLVVVAFALHHLAGVRPFRRALLAVLALPLVGLLLLAAWVGIEIDPLAAVEVPARTLPVWFVCWALPLGLAYGACRRLGHPPERALRRAVTTLPIGPLASLAVFVAPGGALRYNITFVRGTEAVLWWAAFALVLLAGPAVACTVVALAERRS